MFDTTALTNGVHTIGWLITDDCGRADGVGSRFFTILNGSQLAAPDFRLKAEASRSAEFRLKAEATREGGSDGPVNEVSVVSAFWRKSESDEPVLVGRGEREVYWEPAAAFLGRFRLVFSNGAERITVRVVVTPSGE